MKIAVVDPKKKINGLVSYKAKKALEKYRKRDKLEPFSYDSKSDCLRMYKKDGPFDEIFAFHDVRTLSDMGTDELILAIRDIENKTLSEKRCNINRVYPDGISNNAECVYYRDAGGRAFSGNPAVLAVELGKYFENLFL